MRRVLVATADPGDVEVIRGELGGEFRVDVVPDLEACYEAFRQSRREFTFVDVGLLRPDPDRGDLDGYRRSLQPFWQAFASAPVIVLAAPADTRAAVDLVRAGASNYLTSPIHPAELRLVTEEVYEAFRVRSELDDLRQEVWKAGSAQPLQSRNPTMVTLLEKARLVAATETTVLITGETGTGKGEVAKFIHQHSRRSEHQFISVHCGAIPDTLLESELFGHEKGAFTGAVRRKMGKFEIARGGTIFLDEIGTISSAAQVKLLQVLQDRTYQRVGGEAPLVSDARVVAATNVDLRSLVAEGRFRADLFYRLNVFQLEVPPLRERAEDIPLLVEVVLARLRGAHAWQIHGARGDVLEALAQYPWPGNVRELQNLVERAYILEESPLLTPSGFPAEFFASGVHGSRPPGDLAAALGECRRRAVERAEREYLQRLLSEHLGRVGAAAAAAHISPRQLHKLMTRHGVRKEDFRPRRQS